MIYFEASLICRHFKQTIICQHNFTFHTYSLTKSVTKHFNPVAMMLLTLNHPQRETLADFKGTG